jgi:toxin secretion/phage lysis holin
MVDKVKAYGLSAIGIFGSAISSAFGGWTEGMTTLVLFLAIDYITGLAVGVFGKSLKTDKGGLNSNVGYKGLVKKCMVMVFLLIAVRLDMLLGIDYVKNAVIIGFIANELISITENAGLLGLPIPKVIMNIIEILKKKSEEN